MTNSEKKALISEIKELYEWMRDSSGYNLTDYTIKDVIEDDDICEVFVVIHLNNGECIRLRNECFKSFMGKWYRGDEMYYIAEKIEYADEGEDDYVSVNYTDDTDGHFHQCRVPMSSICYIEAYNVYLNWQNLLNMEKISPADGIE